MITKNTHFPTLCKILCKEKGTASITTSLSLHFQSDVAKIQSPCLGTILHSCLDFKHQKYFPQAPVCRLPRITEDAGHSSYLRVQQLPGPGYSTCKSLPRWEDPPARFPRAPQGLVPPAELSAGSIWEPITVLSSELSSTSRPSSPLSYFTAGISIRPILGNHSFTCRHTFSFIPRLIFWGCRNKVPRLGGLKDRNVFSHSSGGHKS